MDPEFTISQEAVRLSSRRPVAAIGPLSIIRPVRPHDHDFFEIALIEEGAIEHRTVDGCGPVKAGQAVMVPLRAVHAFGCGSARITNLYFLPEWFGSGAGLIGSGGPLVGMLLSAGYGKGGARPAVAAAQLNRTDWREVRNEVDFCTSEIDGRSPSEQLVRVSLSKILLLLIRSRVEAAAVGGVLSAEDPLVRRSVDFIEGCIGAGETFDVGGAARRLGCSAGHLHRRFREITGMTPHQAYERRRIQEAARRILNGRHRFAEIAVDLGFSDQAHFSRSFRKERGCTPSEYRRRFAGFGE